MQRSKYWGQPLLLLTAGEIEPTLSSEKFERQTNFPAIKSSSAGKRSLLYKILHQQRDPEPKYPMLLFVHKVKKYSIKKYTELPSLSRQYIHYDYKQKNDKVLILLRHKKVQTMIRFCGAFHFLYIKIFMIYVYLVYIFVIYIYRIEMIL